MSTFLVLVAFAAIVFSPCVVALNATLGDDHSAFATFLASCRMILRRIL
jgi:hypothetical protein